MMEIDKVTKKLHKETDLTLEEIREKGKKAGFSYTQSISVFLFEKVLFWISQSDLKEDVWFKETEMISKEGKKKIIPNELVCYMKNISYKELAQSVKNMLNTEKRNSIQIEWEMLFFDEQIEIVLEFPTEHVIIPFKIIIRPVWDKEQFSKKETYQLLFFGRKEIFYQAYPVELHLAECFYEILSKLELIGDMEPYGTIYQILKNQPINGRRMCLNMEKLLENREIASLEKRWDTILGYQNYTYMKKRWNRYKKNNKNIPVWEDIVEFLNKFFSPIWEAIQTDMIFLEDWMPHLERYLA